MKGTPRRPARKPPPSRTGRTRLTTSGDLAGRGGRASTGCRSWPRSTFAAPVCSLFSLPSPPQGDIGPTPPGVRGGEAVGLHVQGLVAEGDAMSAARYAL